jgi:hypothetical protein
MAVSGFKRVSKRPPGASAGVVGSVWARTVGGRIVSMIVTNRPVSLLRQGYGGQDARAYTSASTVNSEMRRVASPRQVGG